jgi:hypothetical protein
MNQGRGLSRGSRIGFGELNAGGFPKKHISATTSPAKGPTSVVAFGGE